MIYAKGRVFPDKQLLGRQTDSIPTNLRLCWLSDLISCRGAELAWHCFFAFLFLSAGALHHFSHMFIGFATVLIDFLAFVLFPLGFSLVF